jgi:flagellar assembly protein FliH
VTPNRVDIRLPRPLARVSVVGEQPGAAPGETGPPSSQEVRAQPNAQQRLEAELAELQSARTALNEAAEEFNRIQEHFLREAEQQMLSLSLEIARKVLMQEIQAERYEVDPIVAEALCRIPAQTDVVVRMNPDDLARCEMARRDEDASGAGMIRFVSDPGIRPAECLLQTSQGTVEASVEGHFEEITKALTGPE